ncbi:MAG: hypothetical protein Q4D87_08945 [Actinomycetaceae bacterium]|nr:hypothetical protein [Actinomycetaceae bacterium]
MARERVGKQEPSFEVVSGEPVDFTDGEEALELAPAYGLRPDPWQARHVRYALSRRAGGLVAFKRVAQSVPRQNGKNGEIEIIQLHKMIVQGRRILHTAHEVKTARKAFMRLASYFENPGQYPDLAAMVRMIRKANGQEAILLHKPSCSAPVGGGCSCKPNEGGSIEFSARSKGAARGFTVDDLFCDEAQELTDEQLEALLPTMAAAPSGDPQQYFYGTPPSVDSVAEVFPRIHKGAHADKPPVGMFWQEWSIPQDMDPETARQDWVDLAYETNPALGIRIGLDTVAMEQSVMSGVGFSRERLGQWLTVKASSYWESGEWEAASDPTSQIREDSPLAFGVERSSNKSVTHIAVAGFREDGLPHVEIVASRQGSDWVRKWFADRVEDYEGMQVVINRSSPADVLRMDLEEIEGVTVYRAAFPEERRWTERFLTLVEEAAQSQGGARRGLAHLPQPVLDMAVAGMKLNYSHGGAPGVDRKNSATDATPLVASIIALGFLLEFGESVAVRSVYEDDSYSIVVL